MKYYLIAGEASGDLHGSNLMKGIKKADPAAEFRFWGGDKMADEGGSENLVRHYRETAFMGFLEIIKNLRTIMRQLSFCRRDVLDYAPDVLILIDYSGFNLRAAKFAKAAGIKTFYYIAPKVWAWKESRVKKIKKYVDELFIIFPFEIDFFRKHGIEPIYEGNPLMDAIEQKKDEMPPFAEFTAENGLDDRPKIALLAGSRKSEVTYNLPFMAEVSREFPQYQFVLAGVPWLERSIYDELLAGSDIALVMDKTYALLNISQGAIVTSGTATLETALLGTPEIVCYRRDALSMLIGRIVIRVKYVSLVNLVLNHEAVRELLQSDMTAANASAELKAILPGGVKEQKMRDDYAELRRLIGGPGASDRFAAKIVELLNNDGE